MALLQHSPSISISSTYPNKPVIHLISSLLQSCNTTKELKQIHAFILRNALEQDFYAKLLVLCTTAKALHALDYATLVFNHAHEPTTFMWNTMIRGYAHSNAPGRSILLYNKMRDQELLPNNFTFTFLITACVGLSLLDLGRAIQAHAFKFGLPISDVYFHTALLDMYSTSGYVGIAQQLFDRMPQKTSATWNAMIAAYAKRGDVEDARQLFDEMPERDEHSWNIMVVGYGRVGEFDTAGRLFARMPRKTRPTWNAMIAGYTQASKPIEALSIFHQMQIAKVRPDEITMVTLLPACASLGALELGEWLHIYIEKNGFDENVAVCNALIDMYSKCGSIDKAVSVFETMKYRTIVSWNTMISGLAMHGRGGEALELFEEMKGLGVVADDITFVGVLCACGHTGLVEKARGYLEIMKEDYGIEPKIEHYGCMVDVLGRAGLLDEAQQLIETMPIKPNSVVLGALLSACGVHNNFRLGELVLQRLVETEPSNPGYYVLLSNMYANAGRWEEVIKVRNLMRSRGIKKTPGCSSIEIGNKVHEFVVGDKTHPQTEEIYTKLDEITSRLQLAGYVPNTSVVVFDLNEEEKAHNLSLHSEKLAIAFGLLNTSLGKPIRVVKNLRVCKDCHCAIKLISKVYDREIIVRDRSRFHHFRDGQCSCQDYW